MSASMEGFAAIVGAAQVLTGDDAAPYLTDWTGRYAGAADAVLRPGSVEEVAAVIGRARETGVAITLQSGNTSVAGGSVPGPGGAGGVLLSLKRLNRIRSVDAAARTATVDAGVVLQTLQEHVGAQGLDFPLMFGARGAALVGGALATNAGGANVLRYGSARDLCLGLEAVMPDGSIVHGLSGLRKDNTGYDLRHLLIGAEGTLGVITGAVLKLTPTPKARATAFLALSDLSAGLEALNALQDASGGLVEAFEWLPGSMIEAIVSQHPALRAPMADPAATGVLVELASTRADDAALADDGSVRLQTLLLDAVEALMEREIVVDGFFATSEQQRLDLWALREAVLETIVAAGEFVELDVALPLSAVAPFAAQAAPMAAEAGLRPMLVGHLGDGNIHYAVTAAAGRAWDRPSVDRFIERLLDLLSQMGGSFSAEHGIGRSKTRLLAARKDPGHLAAMRRVKAALDPDGVLNPGVVLGDV